MPKVTQKQEGISMFVLLFFLFNHYTILYTTYGKLIGCVKIHHTLNAEFENGGHIAYGIRPSERGKGYATKQLKLALRFAKQIGLQQVVVACDKDNVASAKTAMSCGGVLIKEFKEDLNEWRDKPY